MILQTGYQTKVSSHLFCDDQTNWLLDQDLIPTSCNDPLNWLHLPSLWPNMLQQQWSLKRTLHTGLILAIWKSLSAFKLTSMLSSLHQNQLQKHMYADLRNPTMINNSCIWRKLPLITIIYNEKYRHPYRWMEKKSTWFIRVQEKTTSKKIKLIQKI